MKSLCLKDKDIENINSSELTLSILFTQDGLSYSLYHDESKRFYTLVSDKFNSEADLYVSKCIEMLEKEKILNKNYKSVNIVFAGRKSTIVPEALYHEDSIEEIFALNFNKTEDEKILVCNMPKSGNVLIYSVNKNLYSEISKHFPLMSVFPQSYSFIENHYQKNKIAEDSDIGKMFVQVFDDFIEIIVLKESELKFYNTFSYKTNNDILYFIINVFEQLKLSQTETSIGFSGLIETDNLTILNLRKFVQIVYFESQNPDYKYFYKFQETAPHYFYNFLNIC